MTTLLPSAPAALVAWAKQDPDLSAVVNGRVGTKLASTLPAIRMQRVGGTPDEYDGTDEPAVQVECWAANDVDAERLARVFVSVLPTLRHRAVTGGRAYTYEITSGPFFLPDDPNLSTNVRYLLTISVLFST